MLPPCNFSVEILDHIFSFLVSSRESLIVWSKDPALYSIVERHLYYHLVVHIGKPTCHSSSLKPNHLSKAVSKNPRILNYVRILQIEMEIGCPTSPRMEEARKQLDEFANILRMFPVLECIKLTTSTHRELYWSGVFRAALEGRLNLPTVEEVHLAGCSEFPSSLLDNRENIKNLSLSALTLVTEDQDFVSTKLPKLQSLTLSTGFMSFELLSWIKLHIGDLKSLKYAATSGLWPLSEMLGVCSQTLKKLDINLIDSKYYSVYEFRTAETHLQYSSEFLPIPYNPQQLTLRTSIELAYDLDRKPTSRCSSLAAAVETLKSFISSPQHLILDIDIRSGTILGLADVDFGSLFAPLGALLPIPRIDLYVHTGCDVTHDQLLPLLEDYGNIARLIKDGVLVIHLEKAAPECV